MRMLVFTVLLCLSSVLVAQQNRTGVGMTGPARQSSSAAQLPVKRVVLYKSGVGYFEHVGRVHGNQEVSINFTTAQLNDVLKSLTVVDSGEGRIAGVRYNSTAPIEERLRALHLPLGQHATRAALLEALRGARVDLHNGNLNAVGRLIEVERVSRPAFRGGPASEVGEVSLITDAGELRTFELTPGTSVRLLERNLTNDIDDYLNLIGSSRERDMRRMTISTVGSSDRQFLVSYVSEVPVWKSTYRILMPAKAHEKVVLQGWAIVDNTVGEDWKDVELSLVAGAPQSFVQQISQPYYLRRPEVSLPQAAMLSPQTHEGTLVASEPEEKPVGSTGDLRGTVMDETGAPVQNARITIRNEISGESQVTMSNSHGAYSFNNVIAGNSALFVEAGGFKRFELSSFTLGAGRENQINATLNPATGNQSVMVTSSASTLATTSASIAARSSRSLVKLSPGAVAEQSTVVTTKDLGDLFEYDLNEKITIGKNQSALVPIVHLQIDAEKVTVWNTSVARPLRALWIRNSSGLTLDGGTFNVIENGAFAGEGLLDPIKPAERRLVSYAEDPVVRISAQSESTAQPVTRVQIAKGTIRLTYGEHSSTTYQIHNSDAAARSVVIEHPVREGWKLADDIKAEETSSSFRRFRVNVEPGRDSKLVVQEAHPETNELELTNLTDEQVTVWSQEKTLNPAIEEAFHHVLGQKKAIANVEEQMKSKQEQIEAIVADQTRLRENMKALRGSAEEKALLQRYTQQLNLQEDNLAVLRNETASLRSKRDKLQAELDQMLEEINFDQEITRTGS